MCAGLVGQKREHIKNSLASVRPKWACKQQTHISATNSAGPKRAPVRREREPKRQRSDRSEKRSSKEVPKVIFLFKIALCLSQNCASCLGRDHILVNIVKNYGRKVKNAPQRP